MCYSRLSHDLCKVIGAGNFTEHNHLALPETDGELRVCLFSSYVFVRREH